MFLPAAEDLTKMELEIMCLRNENQNLRERNSKLMEGISEQKVHSSGLEKEDFAGNDAKVKYYTGLPNFAALLCVFDHVSKSSTIAPPCPYLHSLWLHS